VDFFERPTSNIERQISNDEITSFCRFINWQNTLFKIRCWTFIAFYLDFLYQAYYFLFHLYYALIKLVKGLGVICLLDAEPHAAPIALKISPIETSPGR